MADETPEQNIAATVPGYTGSPHEGKGPPNTVPGGSPPNTVASNVGVTKPTLIFKGDGVTPSPS